MQDLVFVRSSVTATQAKAGRKTTHHAITRQMAKGSVQVVEGSQKIFLEYFISAVHLPIS
jgi:hypothetical protein